MDILAEDLSVGFLLEGRYVGAPEDADEAAVFLPDGNHIATLEPAPTTSGWTPTEIPGNPDHPDMRDGGIVLDTEDDIRKWAAQL